MSFKINPAKALCNRSSPAPASKRRPLWVRLRHHLATLRSGSRTCRETNWHQVVSGDDKSLREVDSRIRANYTGLTLGKSRLSWRSALDFHYTGNQSAAGYRHTIRGWYLRLVQHPAALQQAGSFVTLWEAVIQRLTTAEN